MVTNSFGGTYYMRTWLHGHIIKKYFSGSCVNLDRALKEATNLKRGTTFKVSSSKMFLVQGYCTAVNKQWPCLIILLYLFSRPSSLQLALEVMNHHTSLSPLRITRNGTNTFSAREIFSSCEPLPVFWC